jgi:hypothetical protein
MVTFDQQIVIIFVGLIFIDIMKKYKLVEDEQYSKEGAHDMGIEIKEIIAKKILTEAKGYLDVGFTHSLNPYSGCAFSCRYTRRFTGYFI